MTGTAKVKDAVGSVTVSVDHQQHVKFEQNSFTRTVPRDVYNRVKKHLWDGVSPLFVPEERETRRSVHN